MATQLKARTHARTHRSAAHDAGALRARRRPPALVVGRAAVVGRRVAAARRVLLLLVLVLLVVGAAAGAGVEHRLQAGAGRGADGGAARLRAAVAVAERRLVGHVAALGGADGVCWVSLKC